MEKLEEILHAEERARHAVADARVRAREMRIEVAAEAEMIMTAARREAAEEAATVAAAILREADAAAARIAADSENDLAEFLRRTEVRIEAAVRAALENLGR
ncbi:MAG: hypothetical protein ACNA76_01935 [Anaerosomatales bacterium]